MLFQSVQTVIRRLQPPRNRNFAMSVGVQYAILSGASSLVIDYILHAANPGLARVIADLAIYVLYRYWLWNFELDDGFLSKLAARSIFLRWLGRLILYGFVGTGVLLIGSVTNPPLQMLYIVGLFFGWNLAFAVISQNLRRLRRHAPIVNGALQ